MVRTRILAASLALGFCCTAFADENDVSRLAHDWDHAQFEIEGKAAKIAAFHQLDAQAATIVAAHPGSADPIVWQAIVLSSEAGAEGGIGALAKVTRARDLLLEAEKLNPNALGDGSVYTSLGSLYYQVPGFPIGFGNRDKARAYLDRALKANSTGIEPNYFMADFLVHVGDYAHAGAYLERANAAPLRAGREVADAGRRRDIAALLAQVRQRSH